MIRFALLLSFAMLMSLAYPAAAQEKEVNEKIATAEALDNFASLGPGVHAIRKDKKGRIISCVVVGQARISTVLGKAKGLELARNKANIACSAEFVKWLKEEVTIYQSNDEETVILMEGTESGEDDSLSESGKAVEKTSTKIESLSKGLVRGLKIIHRDVDGDGKNYTVVKGWKADTAEGVKRISADLASDEPEGNGNKTKKSTGKAGEGEPKNSRTDKHIESSSATSDDAADFLPN